MLRASDYVRSFMLWIVGRLLSLDTRIGNWQNRKLTAMANDQAAIAATTMAKVIRLSRGGDE